MRIHSKALFFELWEAGVLGNRTNLWDDAQTAFDSRAPEIGFRQIGKSGGGAWEKVPRDQVFVTAERWSKLGRRYILDDGCPDNKRTMQGEIIRTHRGLEGWLETEGKFAMRPAMAAGHMKHRGYLECRMLLARYMDPSSRDDLDALLELHPDAAVEFSCFSVNVGIFPHRNCIFWETRDY